MEKTCSRCENSKPLEAFKRNAMGKEGRHSVCKECCKQRTNTKPKICKECGQEKPASDFRERGTNPYCRPCHNKIISTHRTPGSRARNAKRVGELSTLKYRTDPAHRQKVRARAAVNRAVKAGTLQKPNACPKCGRVVRIHGHHHNGYAREHRLDVEWMCAKCHHPAEAA